MKDMVKTFKNESGKVHRMCAVKLVKEGYDYVVYVDNDVYKRTPVQRYAVQCFNAI